MSVIQENSSGCLEPKSAKRFHDAGLQVFVITIKVVLDEDFSQKMTRIDLTPI